MAFIRVLLPGTHTCPSVTVTAAIAMAMGRPLMVCCSVSRHQNLPVSSTLVSTFTALEDPNEARTLKLVRLRVALCEENEVFHVPSIMPTRSN
jgi:hypothetical protein